MPRYSSSLPSQKRVALAGPYQMIGVALIEYERSQRGLSFNNFASFEVFTQGVSFVSVEILESYLEDLLDPEISEADLFIQRSSPRLSPSSIALIGLMLAVIIGLSAASAGRSLVESFIITATLALPFALLWHQAPREGLMRRLYFAQTVSHETSRRRGTNRPTTPASMTVAH